MNREAQEHSSQRRKKGRVSGHGDGVGLYGSG